MSILYLIKTKKYIPLDTKKKNLGESNSKYQITLHLKPTKIDFIALASLRSNNDYHYYSSLTLVEVETFL